MNSHEIDSYPDATTVPYAANAPSGSTRKPSRHSRHTSISARDAFPPSSLPVPQTSDNAQSSVITYPGNDSGVRNGVGLQRSFSQRARGRPFAEEAFADEVASGAAQPTPEVNGLAAPLSDEPYLSMDRGADRLDLGDPVGTTRRQQLIQDNIKSAAAEAARLKLDRPEPEPSLIGRTAAPEQGARYSGRTDRAPLATEQPIQAANDQREWAPDKSPLQKLEVTLDNISKEEKRARMQEAEMLHQEKTRSRRQPERIENAPITRAQYQGPPSIEPTVIRGLSTTHKDRLQHSTIIESRKPNLQTLAGEKRGFEYQSAAPTLPPGRSVTITRRGQRHSSTPIHHAVTVPVQSPQYEPSAPVKHSRSVSSSQPSTSSPRGPSSTVPADTGAKIRARQELEQAPATSLDRNASHRAALQRLEGDPRRSSQATDVRDRPDTYKTSTPPVTNPFLRAPALTGAGLHTASPLSDGPFSRTSLGYHGSPDIVSVDSPAFGDRSSIGQRQKRRSSVSFKEPFDRRRPIDEWKSAETARLLSEDFVSESRKTQAPQEHKAWWEQDPKTRRRNNRQQAAASIDVESVAIDDRLAEFKPHLFVKCGPLLRYTGLKRMVGDGAKEYWRGTVLLVTQDSQSSYEKSPTLRLFAQPKALYGNSHTGNNDAPDSSSEQTFDPLTGCVKTSRIGRALFVRPYQSLRPNVDFSAVETDDGLFMSTPPGKVTEEQSVSVTAVAPRLADRNGEHYGRHKEIKGVRLYADPDRDVTFWLFKLEIQLGPVQQHVGYRINGGAASGFWVPAENETMHVMFHSCNGFSATVKTDEFCGPDPLWRNVLNVHQSKPFHVMVGGGDQIYNDKVMHRTQHFGAWCSNRNPHYKHHAPMTHEMTEELETFYLDNYSAWFSQGLFSMAASQIPMVNMWDDHDIIDGFGSYPHPFQLSPVFSGVGNIAYKYYMLFQQHSIEAMTSADEPSWVLGYKPGPYIKHLSRSIFLELGREMALLALDCRTERMKNQVLSVDTCDIALERCRKEIVEGQTKHLIVLLGVPIAYPRLNWLENVLTSKALDPVKALGRYGVVKGGFLNNFDGGVEVLDDLDDHWTAKHHKEERNDFIKELQDLAAERSVRITILGGDVHLGAIGQFYSNPKLKIPKDRDHRYMPNVISSAIVNTPPPDMLADVLNKRNKVHHLDRYTDESMIPMFTHDVDGKKRNNKHLLPRRNWCSISKYVPGKTPPTSRSTSPASSVMSVNDPDRDLDEPKRRFSFSREDVNPRSLIRRLSSRKAPPSAYDNPYKSQRPLDPRVDGSDSAFNAGRAASFDDVRAGRTEPRTWNERLGLTRRTASETRRSAMNSEQSIQAPSSIVKPPPFRPGFHRRPTNLSEKAAKKGNVPGIDADGNEIEVNDHVNLDGGLDVILNFEIDKGDPSGATEPYRLLIPGLWYDGSSDREKLHGANAPQRKPTLMNRFGIGARRSAKHTDSAEDLSRSDSYSGTESEPEPSPGKKMGLFGSLRRKANKPQDDQSGLEGMTEKQTMNYSPAATPSQRRDGPLSAHRVEQNLIGSTTPQDTPPKQAYAPNAGVASTDFDHNPLYRPDSSLGKGNVLRKNSLKRQSPPELGRPSTDHGSSKYASNMRPTTSAQQGPYTIASSGQQAPSSRAYVTTSGSVPLGAITAASAKRTVSNMDNAAYHPGPGYDKATTRRPSETIGTRNNGDYQNFPLQEQQTATDNIQQPRLRGNGILGRFGLMRNASMGSKAQDQSQAAQLSSEQASDPEGQFRPPQRTMSQGYSGIEAYRDKPKRGLSLRDRARNILDRVEGRRQYDDDDDDSYDSQDSFSDDLGEQTPNNQGHGRQLRSSDNSRDDAGSFSEDDEAGYTAPKRGLSQKLKIGMMRMGSRKDQAREDRDPDREESRYY